MILAPALEAAVRLKRMPTTSGVSRVPVSSTSSDKTASGSWICVGVGGLVAASAVAYVYYKNRRSPSSPARPRRRDEERSYVPPPKQTDFPLRRKAVEHTVLLPSLSLPPLSTPFDTGYMREQSGEPAAPCLEFQETVIHATPTAFGLMDPSPQDTYAAWRNANLEAISDDCRTMSGGLDSVRSIPGLLKSRCEQTSQQQENLPELGAILGHGSFGKVFKGRWRGARVAVKIIEHSPDINSKIEAFRENMVACNIQHPNVLITYKVITLGQHGKVAGQQMGSLDSAHGSSGHTPQVAGEPPHAPSDDKHSIFEGIQETWLISEFCDKGNLDRAVSGGRFHAKETGTPDLMSIYRCLIDIAAGMDYLHSLGVLHGDLKGANVLMKSTSVYDDPRGFVCKISDFGLSRVLDQNCTHVSTSTYGTVSYSAPEVLKEGKLTKAADVYSFAMFMWEIYTGTVLFRGLNSSQVFYKVMMGYRPLVPQEMPAGYSDLMQACWDEDPHNRPPFGDIVRFLRTLYYNSGEGTPRDSRKSLELNPWG